VCREPPENKKNKTKEEKLTRKKNQNPKHENLSIKKVSHRQCGQTHASERENIKRQHRMT